MMGDGVNKDAYSSLTDIAKYKDLDNAFIVVANWMRNYSTISFTYASEAGILNMAYII